MVINQNLTALVRFKVRSLPEGEFQMERKSQRSLKKETGGLKRGRGGRGRIREGGRRRLVSQLKVSAVNI